MKLQNFSNFIQSLYESSNSFGSSSAYGILAVGLTIEWKPKRGEKMWLTIYYQN